jgi:hypothetical protein
MSTNKYSRIFGALILVGGVLANTSCGDVIRNGRSPVYLVISSMEAASGADPTTFGSILFSDVETLVAQTVNGQQVRVPTTFSDVGEATFRISLRNPGTPTAPLGPSAMNDVTLTRYRVTYTRADGRNTPGVDIPFGLDGGITITVPAGGTATVGFEMVRHQAKMEPPLRNLRGSGGANLISTIADITFWGVDQAGNEVTATGRMTVNFGDFGDPQ